MVSLIGVSYDLVEAAFKAWAKDMRKFAATYKSIQEANPDKSPTQAIDEAERAVFGDETRSSEIIKY